MLVSSDQPGRVVAHESGVHHFAFAGVPMDVPEPVGRHLLELGGFSAAGPQRQGGGPMWLRKAQGGTEVTFGGAVYGWPEDGSVTEVPPELGANLLSIRGAGYSVAEAPKEPKPAPEGGGEEGQGADEGGQDGGDGEAPAARSRARSRR